MVVEVEPRRTAASAAEVAKLDESIESLPKAKHETEKTNAIVLFLWEEDSAGNLMENCFREPYPPLDGLKGPSSSLLLQPLHL